MAAAFTRSACRWQGKSWASFQLLSKAGCSRHTRRVPGRRQRKPSLADATQTSFLLVGVLFLVKAVEVATKVSLAGFGIHPRDGLGLIGILFSPLLHGNAAHLLANAAPLFVLLTLLFWDKRYRPARTLGHVWFVSGLGTWLIGRSLTDGVPTVHIGASSIIYGLVAYLVVAGFLMESWRATFIAILVGLLYGGIVYGALPQEGPVSWEGHFCGAVAGIFAAREQHAR